MENQLPFYINVYNPLSKEVTELLTRAYETAISNSNEYITPEHFLSVIINNVDFKNALKYIGGDEEDLSKKLNIKIEEMEKVPEAIDFTPTPSLQLFQMLEYADRNVISCGKSCIEITHLIKGLMSLEESWAQYILWQAISGEEGFFLSLLLGDIEIEEIEDED